MGMILPGGCIMSKRLDGFRPEFRNSYIWLQVANKVSSYLATFMRIQLRLLLILGSRGYFVLEI